MYLLHPFGIKQIWERNREGTRGRDAKSVIKKKYRKS
jgi:hypothetical protein